MNSAVTSRSLAIVGYPQADGAAILKHTPFVSCSHFSQRDHHPSVLPGIDMHHNRAAFPRNFFLHDTIRPLMKSQSGLYGPESQDRRQIMDGKKRDGSIFSLSIGNLYFKSLGSHAPS